VTGRVLPPILVGLLLAGCGTKPSTPQQPAQAPTAGQCTSFDEAMAGVVKGQVVWQGEPVRVPPYPSPVNPLSESAPGRGLREWPNPCAPAIDPSGGVGQAVVFLRGVDPQKAKPWDLPPVHVTLDNYQIQVHQGDTTGRCAYVLRGTTVGFESRQEVFHSLQARGAAWFALPFPDANRVQARTLSHDGVVELCSGAGHYWMRGYLFVLDHPYVTQTDAQGKFVLRDVPSGKYELVVWHPNWLEASHSRDADTCQICRLVLQPPLEVVRTVEIGPRETRPIQITFPPPQSRTTPTR
jgi:hypothetical protein